MKRILIVDSVRTLSILAVLAAHIGTVYHDRPSLHPSQLPLLQILWWKMCVNGQYGVSLFFVVSGYLITRLIAAGPSGLFKPDFRDFYSRRIGRIVPLLTVVLLIGAFVTLAVPSSAPGAQHLFERNDVFSHPYYLLSILTFWVNWYYILDGHLFGFHWDVLWSLSIEEQFYFFYPFVLSRLRNARNLIVFLTVMISLGPLGMGLGWEPHIQQGISIGHNSFLGFSLIATGCLLYLLSERYRLLLTRNQAACYFLCALGLWMVLKIYLREPYRADHFGFVWGNFLLGMGTFLFLLGALNTRFSNSKFLVPFSLPGKLSYGLYLLHSTVLLLLWRVFPVLNEFIGFFVFAGIATGIAYLSYRYFEVPSNIFLRETLQKDRGKREDR